MPLNDDVQETHSAGAVAFVSSWSLIICVIEVNAMSVS